MIRQMHVAWMSAIVMAGMVFAQGQLAPGKEDDGDDRGAPAVAVKDWSVAVPGWKPVTANEHPRLIFRKDDLPTLRKRAQTPAGKVMIERAQKLLEAPFTTWHAAGHAFLYQVTGDQAWADKAKEAAEQTLARKPNPDGRYTWPGEGQLRAGPCLSALALAYDMAYDGWDAATRNTIAKGIVENKFLEEIANSPKHVPGCNHWGAHTGGAGIALLALRGDAGVDTNRIEELLGKVVNNARREIAEGYGSRGYYYEGHHCGRLSSNTGLVPFIQAYRVAMGRDLVPNSSNAQWLVTKWVYEFVDHPASKGSAGLYTYNSRGMYGREFGREGGSTGGDFSQGFGICPQEHVPTVLWLYNHIIEPGEKTYGIEKPYPHLAAYALANWPIDVTEKNPADVLPLSMVDEGPGYCVFRNGWADKGNIVVTALFGSSPSAGRGMALGGSIMVAGKGLKYTFPGMFHSSKITYSNLKPDGSGVVSGVVLDHTGNGKSGPAMALPKTPTSLAVDYSGASGAPLLVAQVGPQVGYGVEYWMGIKKLKLPRDVKDVTGEDGFATKTTIHTADPAMPWAIMTLQKGDPPAVVVDGNTVKVGGQTLTFDGEKIVLGR
jgi:hypothetical protein